jgi:hypothetical protein
MPKIDEAKLADILNSLLTDNIKIGSDLIRDLEKSTEVFNKNVGDFSSELNSKTNELKELIVALKSAPKLGKTLKISAIIASFVAGAAFAALIYAYPLSTSTYNYIESNSAHRALATKYYELENYALVLQNQNEAYKRSLEKTLTLNGRERFNEIFSEELQKIIQKETK